MTVDEITVECWVTETVHEYPRQGWEVHKCKVTEKESGLEIDSLPMAGLDLKPGDEIELTIRVLGRRDLDPFLEEEHKKRMIAHLKKHQ